MTFCLIDHGWGNALEEAAAAGGSPWRIVCPFIKTKALKRLLAKAKLRNIQVITRFNLDDFCKHVSDLEALELLLARGAEIRGVHGLHAKVYLFGSSRAVVSSANLTIRGLDTNKEFGFSSDDPSITTSCQSYFEALWVRAGENLTYERLASFRAEVTQAQVGGGRAGATATLGDKGTIVSSPDPQANGEALAEEFQTIVKFFGRGNERASRSQHTLETLRRSGAHWACTYPRGKRPRLVDDGDVFYLSNLVEAPNDILIFGRAIGLSHVEGRDDATPEDLALRKWKVDYPYYVRVHHPEVLAGTLEDGISLRELIHNLGSDAFVTTQKHAAEGHGNTDPMRTLRRQPGVRLSARGAAWLKTQFEVRERRFGLLPSRDLETLDWPTMPNESLVSLSKPNRKARGKK